MEHLEVGKTLQDRPPAERVLGRLLAPAGLAAVGGPPIEQPFHDPVKSGAPDGGQRRFELGPRAPVLEGAGTEDRSHQPPPCGLGAEVDVAGEERIDPVIQVGFVGDRDGGVRVEHPGQERGAGTAAAEHEEGRTG
jgi:hypothetical protein